MQIFLLLRYVHSCGRIRKDKDSQEMSTIVVGGRIQGWSGSSVEILDDGIVKHYVFLNGIADNVISHKIH
jgi:hypothetical protein